MQYYLLIFHSGDLTNRREIYVLRRFFKNYHKISKGGDSFQIWRISVWISYGGLLYSCHEKLDLQRFLQEPP